MPDSEEKTPTEKLAERADTWKMARALYRQADMVYTPQDVLMLADWLAGRLPFDVEDDT